MRLELAEGDAILVAIDGDRVTLDSSAAYAPGTPIEARALGTGVRIKVQRCVRAGERFSVEGRLLDATRTLREAIEREIAQRK
jgi:hypothetical protein